MTNQTILVTGVFDLVHPGHVRLLAEIKSRYPDYRLIVGINGDRRTGEIKEHVLFSAAERQVLLEAIRWVDSVIVFEENTPGELIRGLRPSVFVKGPDWAGKELPEAGACAEVGAEIVFVGEADAQGNKQYNSSQLKRRLHAAEF